MKKYVDKDGYSTLKTIRQFNTHFRLCRKCRSFNYYRNKECVLCKKEALDKSFEYDENTFKEVLKEYRFYENKGFDTLDIDNIKLSVFPIDNIRNRDKNFKLNKYLFKSSNNTIVVN